MAPASNTAVSPTSVRLRLAVAWAGLAWERLTAGLWRMWEVARRDGFAVRAIAVLVLAVALIGTWHSAPARLARAIAPAFGEGNMPVTVKVWITPPAYTNRSPSYLESQTGQRDAT